MRYQVDTDGLRSSARGISTSLGELDGLPTAVSRAWQDVATACGDGGGTDGATLARRWGRATDDVVLAGGVIVRGMNGAAADYDGVDAYVARRHGAGRGA